MACSQAQVGIQLNLGEGKLTIILLKCMLQVITAMMFFLGMSYLEPLALFKKLYGTTHFFNLVASFSRLFGAT